MFAIGGGDIGQMVPGVAQGDLAFGGGEPAIKPPEAHQGGQAHAHGTSGAEAALRPSTASDLSAISSRAIAHVLPCRK